MCIRDSSYGALPSNPPPSVIASTPSVTDGLTNIELVSKDITPSYMSYFEPTEEPVVGGRGVGAAEVAMREGPIGNYPATDYSAVYEEQGIPDPSLGNAVDIVNVATNALNDKDNLLELEPLVPEKNVDPLSMESDVGALSNVTTANTEEPKSYGQVNRFGVYAGDGFEWFENESVTNPSGDPVLSRKYVGTDETMNGLGTDTIIANEIAYGNPEDREVFEAIGQISLDEGSEFAASSGSANDGDWVDFIKSGFKDFGASDSYAEMIGEKDYVPTLTYDDNATALSSITEKSVIEPEQIGALPSSTAPEFATTTADYTGLEGVYNTQAEEMANFFTPNDGASYVRGQLVDDATGDLIAPGGTTSTGNVIRGTFDNQTNNIEGFGGLNGAPILNSTREALANLLTPGDNAAYVNGQLVNTLDGTSLEGGGYTTDPVTGQRDYVYGVSDDYSNNLQVDTTGMNDIEARSAIANQVMKRDIPPSDLAYFTSFLPGMTVPLIGGYLGEKMLEGGIKGRKDIIDEQTAALQAGATPIYNEKGEYVGYNDGTTTVDYNPSSYRGSSKDRIDQDSTSIFSQAREARMSGSDDNATNNPVVRDIYNRYYKGGTGYGLPPWLRRYASGMSIDQLLTKEILDDGTVMYKTPDGKYIDAKYLPNAIVGTDEELP
jgi:hypothetical protein